MPVLVVMKLVKHGTGSSARGGGIARAGAAAGIDVDRHQEIARPDDDRPGRRRRIVWRGVPSAPAVEAEQTEIQRIGVPAEAIKAVEVEAVRAEAIEVETVVTETLKAEAVESEAAHADPVEAAKAEWRKMAGPCRRTRGRPRERRSHMGDGGREGQGKAERSRSARADRSHRQRVRMGDVSSAKKPSLAQFWRRSRVNFVKRFLT